MAWNLGTTTVRNPQRIRQGLILFAAEFNGHIHGKEREALFWQRLKETGIVDDPNVEAGRPRKLDDSKIKIARELAQDKSRSVQEICKLLQISRATFYNYTSDTDLITQRSVK